MTTQRGWWRGTGLVAKRSLVEGLRSRAVRVTTVILLLVGLGVVFGPRLLAGDAPTYTLATVGDAPAQVEQQLAASGRAAGLKTAFVSCPDAAAVERAVRRGDATIGSTPDALFVRTDAPGVFTVLVTQALVAEQRANYLAGVGLSAAEIGAAISIAPPPQMEVGPVQDEGRATVGFIIGVALYLALMLSGNLIALNVGMEKSTRIAEVLLSVLRPSQILVGNVLGIGLQTLIQLLVLAVPILGAVALTDGITVPKVAAQDILLGVVWFGIGYFMYAFLFAATAALVDKVSDVGSAIMPVTTALVLAYISAVIVVEQDPNSAMSMVLSMFPLTSLMAMPVRWSAGLVPGWQLALSMCIAVTAAVGLASLGARVYRRAVVITGRRLRLVEMLRSAGR